MDVCCYQKYLLRFNQKFINRYNFGSTITSEMENNPILKKSLSVQYSGNIDNYEYFKRTIGASSLLYKHDLNFYNDDIKTRHLRNIEQLKYLKELLKSGKIQPKMIQHNVINTFYPSFVLHHHQDIFVPLLRKFTSSSKDIKNLYDASIRHQITGAVFDSKLRWDLKQSSNQIPLLNDQGLIQMNQQTYFYSAVTSPYITHAIFMVNSKEGVSLAIVQIRKQNGEFHSSVKTRDFGGTISMDYLPIGYNLSGIKPLIILTLSAIKIQKQVQSLVLKQRLLDFQHSVKDLHKSLWISIKYTTVRKQFRTIQNKKEERSIITYQAVASRIIDAFCTFIMFADIYCKIIEQHYYYIAYLQLLNSAHHCILENLVHLRETCGGFGYMQYSGHPGCIERVAFRAGQNSDQQLDLNPKFLVISQYFASTDQAQKFYCQPIVSQKLSYMHYFGLFISICCNMRRQRSSLDIKGYKREYLRQSAIMYMHAKEDQSRIDAKNIHCLLLQYSVASYILNNISYISQELLQVEKQIFYNGITDYKSELLDKISTDLVQLGDSLELHYLRNTIVGREDSEDFYKELLESSRNNSRNAKEYMDYVRQPIIQMLVENRAKL